MSDKVSLRCLFSNHDRVETTLEYEMNTMIEVVRQGLFDKLSELGIKEPVSDINQLRMFEGGKMLINGKSLAESNVKRYEDHPTAITVSIRPANLPPSITREAKEATSTGCCNVC